MHKQSVDRSAPLWALVPAKRFTTAKQRLQPLLDIHERASLARALLEDLLEILRASSTLDGVAVVSEDSEAAGICQRFDAMLLRYPDQAGLNEAVQYGAGVLVRSGVGGIIVVPADLPLLNTVDLAEVACALTTNAAVLVAAENDGGTNLLACTPPDALPPHFGAGSFHRHLKAAKAAGLSVAVLEGHGARFDIDHPTDLMELARDGGPRFQAFVRYLRREGKLPGRTDGLIHNADQELTLR